MSTPLRYTTKSKRHNHGYLITVTDTQGIWPDAEAFVEFTEDCGMGKGWRTYTKFEGDGECHDAPTLTKKSAIYWLRRDGA